MADGRELTRITNDELENFRLHFSRCVNCDIASSFNPYKVSEAARPLHRIFTVQPEDFPGLVK